MSSIHNFHLRRLLLARSYMPYHLGNPRFHLRHKHHRYLDRCLKSFQCHRSHLSTIRKCRRRINTHSTLSRPRYSCKHLNLGNRLLQIHRRLHLRPHRSSKHRHNHIRKSRRNKNHLRCLHPHRNYTLRLQYNRSRGSCHHHRSRQSRSCPLVDPCNHMSCPVHSQTHLKQRTFRLHQM